MHVKLHILIEDSGSCLLYQCNMLDAEEDVSDCHVKGAARNKPLGCTGTRQPSIGLWELGFPVASSLQVQRSHCPEMRQECRYFFFLLSLYTPQTVLHIPQ